jgi:hypothetical protein
VPEKQGASEESEKERIAGKGSFGPGVFLTIAGCPSEEKPNNTLWE